MGLLIDNSLVSTEMNVVFKKIIFEYILWSKAKVLLLKINLEIFPDVNFGLDQVMAWQYQAINHDLVWSWPSFDDSIRCHKATGS